MDLLTMDQLDVLGQRVLIRSDLNVPLQAGKITSEARILASLPTYRQALEMGARVMVMSHLGRPKEGYFDENLSLAPVAKRLEQLLERPVRFIKDWLEQDFTVEQGELVLLENVRFLTGEMSNDNTLAKKMAALCDIYVMDAFGTAHRSQASTEGVGMFASAACAGPLLSAELSALNTALNHPKRPLLAIIGGSKISSKLSVLESLSIQCDQIIPGGGIANTFLAAAGMPVGKSLIEESLVAQAKRLMEQVSIPLPTDVVVAKELSSSAQAEIKDIANVKPDDMILDVGPATRLLQAKRVMEAQTILWNGPVGVFEIDQFGQGTKALAEAIAHSPAYSIAGGGDTLAAVEKYQVENKISYISTGGGAFLEYVEGKTLPAVAMLQRRKR